ncbi:MAG: hypothetical protein ACRDF4_09055, partial [Rhabdochlamydiaceae bacterium]
GNLVFLNNATRNDAGVALLDSSSNDIAKNSLSFDKYGVYLSNAPGNMVSDNNFFGDQQNQYPNQPMVSFSNVNNGTGISGRFSISWAASGQALSIETLIVDGVAQHVSGSSFVWNSAALADGMHTITIQVTNSGGLSASATVLVLTSNQGLLVETVGPGSIPIPGATVQLRNSTLTLTATSDSAGDALFRHIGLGSYTILTTVNGTLLSVPVSYEGGNSTVVLYTPSLVTTAHATLESGTSVSIKLNGNITSSQLSSVSLKKSNVVHSLSFSVATQSGTSGQVIITIPKSSVPSALVPNVIIDGSPAKSQSYTQDANNYYVKFSASFDSSKENVVIQFSPLGIYYAGYAIVIGVIVALLAAGLALAFRRSNHRSGNYFGSILT